jgi:hypothetical protein
LAFGAGFYLKPNHPVSPGYLEIPAVIGAHHLRAKASQDMSYDRLSDPSDSHVFAEVDYVTEQIEGSASLQIAAERHMCNLIEAHELWDGRDHLTKMTSTTRGVMKFRHA